MEKRLPPGHQIPHPLSSSLSLRSEHFRNPVERVGRAQVAFRLQRPSLTSELNRLTPLWLRQGNQGAKGTH